MRRKAASRRKALPADDERRLEDYYGNQCVVTGGDWERHHLDDDPGHSTFENVIPLSAKLNLHLRDVSRLAKKEREPALLLEVEPDSLLVTAARWFNKWKLGPAYGCARLSYFIAAGYLGESAERRLPRACRALYYARHRVQYRLILDVIERDIAPTIAEANRLSPAAMFALVREFAGVYAEHGRANEAAALYRVFDEVPDLRRLAASSIQEYPAVLRREATTLAAAGQRSEAMALFREAVDAAGGDPKLVIATANSNAWTLIANGEYSTALEILEPVVERCRKLMFTRTHRISPTAMKMWDAAELFQNYAIALSGARPHNFKTRRSTAVRDAQHLFDESGSRAYELGAGFQDQVSRDVGVELLGVRDPLPTEIDRSMTAVIRMVDWRV